ncbi:MAG: ligase-associated DNA damage response endonuclease PdeM [Paracoccaceae bacterium]|jgi:DNA ligase-associated metallophosphoesterase
MSHYAFSFKGQNLFALASGALWWPEQRVLCVSDLHLGKSERQARENGVYLPPYETRDTLVRLEEDVRLYAPKTVVCLGDSFDDVQAAEFMPEETKTWIAKMQAGCEWIWIQGNHDAGPVDLGGTYIEDWVKAPLVFRHIAITGSAGEISGHYHPKAAIQTRGGVQSRRCFLIDENKVIMPAFGTYTGGLRSDDPAFAPLMSEGAIAVLTGTTATPIPMPRKKN